MTFVFSFSIVGGSLGLQQQQQQQPHWNETKPASQLATSRPQSDHFFHICIIIYPFILHFTCEAPFKIGSRCLRSVFSTLSSVSRLPESWLRSLTEFLIIFILYKHRATHS